jgi:hypothetical protein
VSARREILPIFIPHLGCTHACVFCNQSAITDRDAENALRALDELLSSCAPCGAGFDTRCENSPIGKQDGSRQGRELAFYGGSFTAIPPEQQLVYLEKAKKALDAGLIASVRLSTRPDAIDAETLDRLRRYGVATVELGAQSMMDEVLRFNASEAPTKMGTFPQYDHPHTLARYAMVADYLGCGGNTDEEKFAALIQKIDELKAAIGIKPTIRDYVPDEQAFLATLDEMVEQAFDDQCTGANTRYPLMREIKQMYLDAYYGKTFEETAKPDASQLEGRE